MNCIKKIVFYIIFMTIVQPSILGVKAMGQAAAETLVQGTDTILQNNLPATAAALAAAGTDFGRNICVGTLETIGAGITKVAGVVKDGAMAAKDVAIKIANAPATPYILGAAGAGGAVYIVYKSYNLTPEQIIAQKQAALKKCLDENQTAQRAASGVPCPCQDKACSLALAAGKESVDKLVGDFVAYAPEVPAQTMWQRAGAVCSSIANSSAASAAHSIMTAPYDYTIGAAANRSGLTDAVANLEFIKNDRCYSATAGNSALNVGKYAVAVAAVYGVYRGAKAVYNYATKPASK